MTNGGQPQNRLRGIDSLRGLAAMAVVLFHYTTCYDFWFGRTGSGLLFYLPKGCFGVQLFFIISGFVRFKTLDRPPDLKTFAVARSARLYPPFFICVTIALAVVGVTHWHIAGINRRCIS